MDIHRLRNTLGAALLLLTLSLAASPAAWSAGARAAAPVTVLRSSVCAAIMDREPFPATASKDFKSEVGLLYFWNDLAVDGSTVSVRHRWSVDGAISLEVRLQARPPRTRTWSSARIRAGSWKVEVLSESGSVLKAERFKVLP